MVSSHYTEQTAKKYQWAFTLSLITIGYNLVEGAVSTSFGSADETLVLFGFGIDSLVEVISGVGIAHMILRIKHHPVESRDQFEVAALRITGTAFYILASGLLIGSLLSILAKSQPQTTNVGIVISIISIITMYFLYKEKLKVGNELHSEPIISDAKCTKTCFYLSFVLLGSSVLYALLKLPYIDALGSLGVAWYALREGRESFQKARHLKLNCDC